MGLLLGGWVAHFLIVEIALLLLDALTRRVLAGGNLFAGGRSDRTRSRADVRVRSLLARTLLRRARLGLARRVGWRRLRARLCECERGAERQQRTRGSRLEG